MGSDGLLTPGYRIIAARLTPDSAAAGTAVCGRLPDSGEAAAIGTE